MTAAGLLLAAGQRHADDAKERQNAKQERPIHFSCLLDR
jgi:hypothetical protein